VNDSEKTPHAVAKVYYKGKWYYAHIINNNVVLFESEPDYVEQEVFTVKEFIKNGFVFIPVSCN